MLSGPQKFKVFFSFDIEYKHKNKKTNKRGIKTVNKIYRDLVINNIITMIDIL